MASHRSSDSSSTTHAIIFVDEMDVMDMLNEDLEFWDDFAKITFDDDVPAEAPAAKKYVDTVRKWDILPGRGGNTNKHTGNKRYRKIVGKMRATYTVASRTAKTELSNNIVNCVGNYGGRFLKMDEEGRLMEMSKDEARKKTSQALRETKPFKWTDVDEEDDLQV